MFLHGLNNDEKNAFLNLATLAMSADGIIADSEKELLENFKHECELPDFIAERKDKTSVLNSLSNIPEYKKRIILVELFSMVNADGVIDSSEEKFLKEIQNSLSLGDNDYNQLKYWTLKMQDTINEGYKLIQGEQQ